MPAAPPLLSMTMGAPSAAEISWATSRVIWSAAPPAGQGTTNRIGAFCANAAVAAASAKARQPSGAKGLEEGYGTTSRRGGCGEKAEVAAGSAKASQTSGAKGREARFMGVSPG